MTLLRKAVETARARGGKVSEHPWQKGKKSSGRPVWSGPPNARAAFEVVPPSSRLAMNACSSRPQADGGAPIKTQKVHTSRQGRAGYALIPTQSASAFPLARYAFPVDAKHEIDSAGRKARLPLRRVHSQPTDRFDSSPLHCPQYYSKTVEGCSPSRESCATTSHPLAASTASAFPKKQLLFLPRSPSACRFCAQSSPL